MKLKMITNTRTIKTIYEEGKPLPKRNKNKDKALTNNQTPKESLFNQEVSSELVDKDGQNAANNKSNKGK